MQDIPGSKDPAAMNRSDLECHVTIDGTAVAVLHRTGLLWRDAVMTLLGHDEGAAAGLKDIMTLLHGRFGSEARVTLPLHEGYWAMYGPDGVPVARALKTPDGWRFRRFEPHQSVTVPTLHAAIDLAYGEAQA